MSDLSNAPYTSFNRVNPSQPLCGSTWSMFPMRGCAGGPGGYARPFLPPNAYQARSRTTATMPASKIEKTIGHRLGGNVGKICRCVVECTGRAVEGSQHMPVPRITPAICWRTAHDCTVTGFDDFVCTKQLGQFGKLRRE
jgi:hypothetical protein